jgi:hypothetical protein
MTEVQNPRVELKRLRTYSKDMSLLDKRVWLVNYLDGTKPHYFCRIGDDDDADGPKRSYFSIIGGSDYKEEYDVTVLKGALVP